MATRNAAFRRLPDAAFVPRKADGAARAKESESAAKSQLNPRALRLVSLCGQCCSRHNEVHIAADEDNRTCRCSFGVLLVVSATANDAQRPIGRLIVDQSVLLVNPAREKPLQFVSQGLRLAYSKSFARPQSSISSCSVTRPLLAASADAFRWRRFDSQ